MIDSEDILVDPAKIDSIKDWASLKTPTKIRQFLGLADSFSSWKAECVEDALSRKEMIKPLRVRALMMTIELNLPSQILNAQVEAMKEENVKEENLHGLKPSMDLWTVSMMSDHVGIKPPEILSVITMSQSNLPKLL
ncbi:hypothetical protein Tco_1166560 [Tanacetum coccineum]